MRIISVVLTFIGFVLCFFGSVGVQVLLRQTLAALANSESAGIGAVARGFDNAMLSSYVAIFGSIVVLLGLLCAVVSLFTDRKRGAV